MNNAASIAINDIASKLLLNDIIYATYNNTNEVILGSGSSVDRNPDDQSDKMENLA